MPDSAQTLALPSLTRLWSMPTTRFEPSLIKNKIKRNEVVHKSKKAKGQLKLQRRLALAKLEANDPAAKKVFFFFFQYDQN